ncbi:MAG: galactokinase family protein [Oscillospiraceae bacterium]
MNTNLLCEYLANGNLDSKFSEIYDDIEGAKTRYIDCVKSHETQYGHKDDLSLFSTPGRTEICGNHTDHQHGCVVAASISLDIVAAVCKNNDNVIRVLSKGYAIDEIDLSNLEKVDCEKNKSISLIRGIAYKMKELGCEVCGFDAYTTSDVLAGSGLSSSAAFEVMIATIINSMFNNDKLSMVELAKISQFAEREYFGKPSGLMDQTACAYGGCVFIDFEDNHEPKIENITFDLASHGYKLVIVNTGANHADLTDDYASVPRDMKLVANWFGAKVLREVNQNKFYSNIAKLRKDVGDKAVLRAAHFFNENMRVLKSADTLRNDDINGFLKYENESGKSSFEFLQNVYSDKNPNEQSVSLALCLTEQILGSACVCRVHGGGFAGTIQAYVKAEKLDSYVHFMEDTLFKGCCYVLNIRPYGSIQVI